MRWARVVRGIMSMLKLVIRLRARIFTASRLLSGRSMQMRAPPSRQSSASCAFRVRFGSGGWIFKTTSERDQKSAVGTMDAPASWYARSSKKEPVPAPVSTSTSQPAALICRADSGVTETRCSFVPISLAIPTVTGTFPEQSESECSRMSPTSDGSRNLIKRGRPL